MRNWQVKLQKYLPLFSLTLLTFLCLTAEATTLYNPLPTISNPTAAKSNKFKEHNTSPYTVADTVLVKFKPNTSATEINSAITSAGAEVIKHIKFIRVYHIRLGKDISVIKAIEILEKNPVVEYAEPEQVYHTNN